MTEDSPRVPDLIIDRAVELWCRALATPLHDNGDRSEAGFITRGMAAMNAESAIAEVDDYAAAIERFRERLSTTLKFQRDNEGKPTGETNSWGDVHYHLERHLETDYRPCETLAAAAREAGVPAKAFSWKSDVSFWADDHVSSKFGYAAQTLYHYPLSDGSWLICELRGPQMPLIIKAVEEGRLPELTVEPVAKAMVSA